MRDEQKVSRREETRVVSVWRGRHMLVTHLLCFEYVVGTRYDTQGTPLVYQEYHARITVSTSIGIDYILRGRPEEGGRYRATSGI